MFDSAHRQRWIDSLSFLPMGLAKTPSAMGFEDLEKGYFPHKFNTRENEGYLGPYPDPSYYGYDNMCDRAKKTFMMCYDTVRGVEIHRYCVNDVEVLRKACTIYRDTFIRCTELNPYAFTTLASSCMGMFKTLFLQKGQIALTYEGTYTQQKKAYLDVSILWLEYLAHTEKIEIRHALNLGEQQIGSYFVDGYDVVTNTCYEFAGCFYHGCPKCHVESDSNPITHRLRRDVSGFHGENRLLGDTTQSSCGCHVGV